MGPLVSEGQLRSVDGYVRDGRRSGMRAADRRQALSRRRNGMAIYYSPTVFDRVPHDSPLATEEIFGPVLPVLRSMT